MRKPRFLTDFELLYSSVAMEIRFDDELTCWFALEVEWSTATHVSVVSQRGSECQTLLQNGQFISELRKGTKPVIRLWQEKVFICYFRSFQNFSMKSNCLTLGQKSPKSLIATAAILVVRTARGAGATSLPGQYFLWPGYKSRSIFWLLFWVSKTRLKLREIRYI